MDYISTYSCWRKTQMKNDSKSLFIRKDSVFKVIGVNFWIIWKMRHYFIGENYFIGELIIGENYFIVHLF